MLNSRVRKTNFSTKKVGYSGNLKTGQKISFFLSWGSRGE